MVAVVGTAVTWVRCLRLYTAPTMDARYVVWSRHSANMIPAIFLASATIAMNWPRRSAICAAQRTMGSVGRRRTIAHAAWIKVWRTDAGPALVMLVRRSRSELELSPGVRPRYDWSR